MKNTPSTTLPRTVRGKARHWAVSALLAGGLFGAILSSALPARAGVIDPNISQGKKLLYITHIYPNHSIDEIKRLKAAANPRLDRIKEVEDEEADRPKMLEHFASLGFVVTMIDDDIKNDGPKLATGQDLIVIAEFVGGSEVNSKYKNVPIPVVCMENDIFDDMNMTGKKIDVDYGEVMPGPRASFVPARYMFIINPTHPLAAGLPPGILDFFNSKEHMNWGVPCRSAIVIATLPGYPDQSPIFAYEKGAMMDAEFIAPARRVAFPLRTLTGLYPAGVALYDAALRWAVSPPGSN